MYAVLFMSGELQQLFFDIAVSNMMAAFSLESYIPQ